LFVSSILKGKTTPFKIAAKLLIASRNGKGAVAFKNRKATVFQMRSVSWVAHLWYETDMHPVDLIRDSSMSVTPKF
jgi:hypothetical protein